MTAFGYLNNYLDSLKKEITELFGIIEDQKTTIDGYISNADNVKTLTTDLHNNILDLRKTLQTEINSIAKQLISKDYYDANLGISEKVRKDWFISPNGLNELRIELSNPEIWKYPICCIGLDHHDIFESVLPAETVYVAETDTEILNDCLDKLDNLSRNRIRQHRLKSLNELDFETYISPVQQNIRWGVPHGQIGYVVTWNLFERYTIEVMTENLAKIEKLLRPGGRVIFTINDADSVPAAISVTTNSCSYATRSLVEQACQESSLELVKYHHVVGKTTAMVVAKKAGELTSAKTRPGRGMIKKS
jgi:hypothetical protein